MEIKDRISNWLRDHFEETDCFFVKATVSKDFNIRVFVDGDKGIQVGTCARASRFLEEKLEEHNLVPAKYKLEVSSPGVAEPLLLKRQYPQHKGRKFEIETKDGQKLKGRLQEVKEEAVVLEIEEKSKDKGKKKKDIIIRLESIAFDDIRSAYVKISF